MWCRSTSSFSCASVTWEVSAASDLREEYDRYMPSATRPAEDAVQQRLERHVCRLNKRGLAAGPVGPQFCPTDLDPAPKRPGGGGPGRAEF